MYAPDAPHNFFSPDFTPASANDYVYAFQVINSGSSNDLIVHFSMGGLYGVDNAGWFDASAGNTPSPPTSTPHSVDWDFGGNPIAGGQASSGLAFSSPNPPGMAAFGEVGDGSSLILYPLPGPVPEPASMVMWALLALACGAWGWKNARNVKSAQRCTS